MATNAGRDSPGQGSSAPGAGHNRPPVGVSGTVLQQIEAIVDSSLPATEKLCAIKIRLRVDAKTLGGGYPSYATLKKAASVKDARTVQAALDNLCKDFGLLVRNERPGQSHVFGFSQPQLEELICDWITKAKSKRALPWDAGADGLTEPPSPDVGGNKSGPPSMRAGGNGEPPAWDVGGGNWGPPSFGAESVGEPPSPDVPLSGKNIREGKPSNSDPGPLEDMGTAQRRVATALNPETADVWWTADGRLEVANGFKRELEGFADVNLTDGLAIVAGEQMGTNGMPLARGIH